MNISKAAKKSLIFLTGAGLTWTASPGAFAASNSYPFGDRIEDYEYNLEYDEMEVRAGRPVVIAQSLAEAQNLVGRVQHVLRTRLVSMLCSTTLCKTAALSAMLFRNFEVLLFSTLENHLHTFSPFAVSQGEG